MNSNNHGPSRSQTIRRVCIVCSEADPACLERHSITGIEVTICRRCCHEMVNRTSPVPSSIWTPPDDLEIDRARSTR